MFDTNIINGCTVTYIEPNSLIHNILSFVAAKKIMAILCSDDESIEDSNLIKINEIYYEFNLNHNQLNWLYALNILNCKSSLEKSANLIFHHVNYVSITAHGEEILDYLNKNEEVELYLD